MYIEFEEEQPEPQTNKFNLTSSAPAAFGTHVAASSGGTTNNAFTPHHEDLTDSDAYHGSSQRQQQTVKVDTETSRNALRIATQTKELGIATLAELTVQAG
jgi:hypothetical protein